MAVDVKDAKARLARGEQLPGGVCWNPDRKDEFYECSEEEQKIAAGELSVSYDGRTVTDLRTGQVTTREQPKEYKIERPVTLAEVAEAAGGAVASGGGDTVTTDNAPAGGRGRNAR